MKQNNVISISNPQETTADALTSILRQGAQQLLAKALEAEIEILRSVAAVARGAIVDQRLRMDETILKPDAVDEGF